MHTVVWHEGFFFCDSMSEASELADYLLAGQGPGGDDAQEGGQLGNDDWAPLQLQGDERRSEEAFA
jgi:hypothetical protein